IAFKFLKGGAEFRAQLAVRLIDQRGEQGVQRFGSANGDEVLRADDPVIFSLAVIEQRRGPFDVVLGDGGLLAQEEGGGKHQKRAHNSSHVSTPSKSSRASIAFPLMAIALALSKTAPWARPRTTPAVQLST